MTTVGDLIEALSRQPRNAPARIAEHHPIRGLIRVPGVGARPMPVADLIANLQMVDDRMVLDFTYPKGT